MTWLDLKLGIRMLLKYPGLSLAGGAGIAVAVAIAAGGFSFIQGNFLPSSLPLDEGDRIVSIELWDSAAGKPEPRTAYDYQLWRESLPSVRELSAFQTITPSLILTGTQPISIRGAAMSASGFKVARVHPLLGRTLQPADEQPNAPAVAVISEELYRGRLEADPSILGRPIQLGSGSYTVVGVMPKGFAFPVNHRFWIPLPLAPPAARLTGPPLSIFGRLAPDANFNRAQAELSAIETRAARALPEGHPPLKPRALPFSYPFLGLHQENDVTGIFATQSLCLILLVLVCLNVAILVYTRTAMRESEINVRTALGASRSRIVSQLFLEALVLSAVAAAAGVALAAFGLRQIAAATSHLAADLPFWTKFDLLPQAVLYAVVLSVLAAAIVGVIPGLQATRGRLQPGLRIAGAGGSAMRLGRIWTILIVTQVGFTVALLPPAVGLAWQESRNSTASPGFAADHFLTAELGMDILPASQSTATAEPALKARFAARQIELTRRLETDPRVSAATYSRYFPGDERNAWIEVEGSSLAARNVRHNRVGPGFFQAFDVPVLAGRAFQPSDAASSGNVIVNQSLAQILFNGQALGRRIRYQAGHGAVTTQPAGFEPWYEIIGVVSDFPTGVSPGMDESKLVVYHAVPPGELRPAVLAVRLREGDPAGFTQQLRTEAAAVDPDLQLEKVRSLETALRSEQWITRLQAAVAAAVTLSVLLLSSAGVYALMSFTVSQRRKEIGIRLALGAEWKQIVASIFRRATLQLSSGALLGAALGYGLQQASGGDLIPENAGTILAAVALALILVGLLAALGPARRSLSIDPTEALRQD